MGSSRLTQHGGILAERGQNAQSILDRLAIELSEQPGIRTLEESYSRLR